MNKHNPMRNGVCSLLTFGILPFLLQGVCFAQETDGQQWTLLTFNARFKNRTRLYLEAQPRLGYDYQKLDRLLLRPAIGYQVSPTASVWFGYGWTPTFQPDLNHEGRWFQQLLLENRYAKLDVVHRTRLEERSIAGAGGQANRFRHMARLSYPISLDRKWSVIGYDEVFINLNSTPRGPKAGFDQNRVYLGIGHSPNRHVRYEVGYIATSINSPGNRRDRRLDILFLGVNYNL